MFIFVALAVLLDFLLQVTAFVALIVFDFLRAEDNRIDCFPCIKLPSSSVEPNEGICAGLLSLYIYIYIYIYIFVLLIPNLHIPTFVILFSSERI